MRDTQISHVLGTHKPGLCQVEARRLTGTQMSEPSPLFPGVYDKQIRNRADTHTQLASNHQAQCSPQLTIRPDVHPT